MTSLELLGRVAVNGKIHLLSGLHIGAGKDTIEIGGIDNPIIKHPRSGDPYIPGSSLKGKLRFLLEWAFGRVRNHDGKPWGTDDHGQPIDADDPVLRLFGTAIKKEAWQGGPTRLMVRDAPLCADWRKQAVADAVPLTEEKTEVVIDRIAGKAHDRIGPRQTERVPAGTVFDMEMVMRIFSTDGDAGARDAACLNWLLAGLSLLELDALGGSGSRGYGRIRFENLTVVDLQGQSHRIDNTFRVGRFDPEVPPPIVALQAA